MTPRVTLTYTRGVSITHHVVKSKLGQFDEKRLSREASP